MNKRILYIQIILEAALPIFGFFFWDWNLYFILLFYFFDLIANELTIHLKANQIKKHHTQNGLREWLTNAVVSSGVLVLSIILIHVAMRLEQPSIDFAKEAIAFWTYEEMGIQQGYLFFPLVFYMAYQEYKMQFLLPARYRTTTMKQLWKEHNFGRILLLIGAAIGCVVLYFVSLPEIIIVLSIIGAVASISLWKLNQR